jgi:hypothetical protein
MDAVQDDSAIIQVSRRRCFVVSPIGQYGSETRNHMDIVFHCIIEPALSDRYEVIRGDHIARPGRITEQFIEDILENDLIVCVLTGNTMSEVILKNLQISTP